MKCNILLRLYCKLFLVIFITDKLRAEYQYLKVHSVIHLDLRKSLNSARGPSDMEV